MASYRCVLAVRNCFAGSGNHAVLCFAPIFWEARLQYSAANGQSCPSLNFQTLLLGASLLVKVRVGFGAPKDPGLASHGSRDVRPRP